MLRIGATKKPMLEVLSVEAVALIAMEWSVWKLWPARDPIATA